MPFRRIQQDVDRWTAQFTPQYWPPHEMLARMAEELGEVAREVNHLYGNKKKKPDEKESSLGQELSDMLFTAACIANSYRITIAADISQQPRSNNTPYSLLADMMIRTGSLAESILASSTYDLEHKLSSLISPIAGMASYHGIDLQKQWDIMMRNKMYKRDKDRYEKK